MQGGINNAALFGATQRSARSKLDQMAGISRPSGILASSPELMQAAMPMAPAPQPMPMPMAPQPVAAPTMPNMPMNTAVAPMAPAPRPLNPMAAGPAVQQPASPNTPMRFKPGGEVDVAPFRPQFQGDVPADAQRLDITMDTSEFDRVLKTLNPQSTKYLLETYGDEDGIAQAAQKKLNNVSAAAQSMDPAQISDQVLVEAGEQPTDAAKMDFAANVFGLDDVNDIDEINRRIANVAIGSAVGKGPDEFAKAVLMGLQTYKQTASARAAGAASAAGGSSFTKDRTALRAYQDTLDSLTRSMSDTDLPDEYEGTVADYAAEQALKQVLQTYPTNQIPPQLLNQADGQPASQGNGTSLTVIGKNPETGQPASQGNGTSLTVIGRNPETGQLIADNPDGSGTFVDATTGEPI